MCDKTSMNIIVRDCCNEDKDVLLAINDNWGPGIKAIFEVFNPNCNSIEKCLVAEINQKIVGFIYGYILPHGTVIPHFMYIFPEYRRKGIATKLLLTFEEKSDCVISQIYFNKELTPYYEEQGYLVGKDLTVAIKYLKEEQ